LPAAFLAEPVPPADGTPVEVLTPVTDEQTG
jgi:hypothetical protein